MRPASLLTVLLLSLVAVIHLLRLILRTEILVGSAIVPMWVSVVGIIIPGALAVALWREAKRADSARAT